MRPNPLLEPNDGMAARQAGREALSLALLDARNQSLALLAGHGPSEDEALPTDDPDEPASPAWMAGHAAWLAEWWIARNPQRALGAASPADGMRLGSIEPLADAWFHPSGARWEQALPEAQRLRAYMLEQLELTLELLAKAEDSDQGLYLFRAVLFHEDTCAERLVTRAQSLGRPLAWALPRAAAPRAALHLPATRWQYGSPPQGFAPALERPDFSVDVPEFEIDAQPVSWSQYVEFVDDAGYDRPELWDPEGWRWLQALGRRAPRHVEQIGVASGAVMQTLFGRPTRLAAQLPAMHVSWWEADAWARWAGRRLPTEVEWEVAAHLAARRGFRWGEVHEWTAATLRPRPGFQADAWTQGTCLDPQPMWERARVRRGASFATSARLRHPKARSFALPSADHDFVGFRTCAP